MTNKNPFEIRADMLQLAKEYMDQQQQINVQFAEAMMEKGKKSLEDIQESYQMYSMEDLMEKAKEMYSFVSKKD
jgi:ABC-type transporter lipoprotein component MlaA